MTQPTSNNPAPRRIVLLRDRDDGEIERVLAEYSAALWLADLSFSPTVELRKHAAMHPGRRIAAEWLGPLGWIRFLWIGPPAVDPVVSFTGWYRVKKRWLTNSNLRAATPEACLDALHKYAPPGSDKLVRQGDINPNEDKP